MAARSDTRRRGVEGNRFLGFVALAVLYHVGWWLIAPSDEEFVPAGLVVANVVAFFVGIIGDRLLRSSLSIVITPFALTTVGMVVFLVIEAYRHGPDHISQLTSDPAVSIAIAGYAIFFLFWLSFVFYGMATLVGAALSLLIRQAQARHGFGDAESPR